jgi:hypothetical protein
MDQDQERDYEEEKYNEGLMHDAADPDEPEFYDAARLQYEADHDAASDARLDELERQQGALGRDVFGFPLESAEVADAEANRIQAAQEAAWEAASEEVPEAEPEADDGVMHGDTFYWLQPTSAGHAATREQQGDFAALPEDLRAQYLGDRAAEMAADDDAALGGVVSRMARDGVPGDQAWQVAETARAWAASPQASPSEPEAEGLDDDGFLAAPSAEDAAAGWDEPAEHRQGRTEPESRVIVAGDEQQLAAVTVTRGRELPVPYELTELGGYQAVADQMTEREVGSGYLEHCAAEREAGS